MRSPPDSDRQNAASMYSVVKSRPGRQRIAFGERAAEDGLGRLDPGNARPETVTSG